MKKALEIVRALPGAGRAAAVSCINIANLLVIMGNADEADEYAKSAMGLLESAGQSDGIDYAAALAAGAKAALLRSDYDRALRNYEDAGKLMKNDSGRTDAYRAIIGRQIEILEMSGRKEEAERLTGHMPTDRWNRKSWPRSWKPAAWPRPPAMSRNGNISQ